VVRPMRRRHLNMKSLALEVGAEIIARRTRTRAVDVVRLSPVVRPVRWAKRNGSLALRWVIRAASPWPWRGRWRVPGPVGYLACPGATAVPASSALSRDVCYGAFQRVFSRVFTTCARRASTKIVFLYQ
jgi:hypothetical protein